MDLGLKDATAVVAGGGGGMGFAAACCLADDGARVAVVGRTKEVLDRAAKDLTDRGSPDPLGLVADTGDANAVQRVFDKLSTRWDGELNVLINAVGPGTRGTFDDLADEQWREAFDDGVMGMVHCVRFGSAAAPQGAVGADRQLLRPFDATPDRHPARLPGRQGGGHQHLEEPVAAAGPRRDPRQRRLPGQHRVGGAGRLGAVGRGRRRRPLCADGRDRQALRASSAHAAGGQARRNRPRRRISRIAAQFVHDRRQHQRRRR